MAELRWTAEAENSLREIHDYIARDRPATASRTLDSILHRAASLLDVPTLGQPYAYDSDPAIRVLTYGQFQIAYRVGPGGRVTILGVFHGLIFLPLK